MAIELSDGSYARLKIWERNLFEGIFKNKENQRKIKDLGGKHTLTKFTILPYTYFSYCVPDPDESEKFKHYYIFFFQLRIFFKKGVDKYYNFCCENLIIRYDEDQII